MLGVSEIGLKSRMGKVEELLEGDIFIYMGELYVLLKKDIFLVVWDLNREIEDFILYPDEDIIIVE